MGWDPVPMMIGGDIVGGAEHSTEVFRLVNYLLLGGQEGVLGELDLRVLPLSTPGQGYRVMPGAAGIVSKWQPSQQYVGRCPTEDIKTSTVTTASARSDLVVVNIKDPFVPGSPWTPPGSTEAERRAGPYIETAYITGVPDTTTKFSQLGITNWSALALARIDQPPSNATITSGMIKDLRVVTNPATGIEYPPTEVTDPQGGNAPKTYKAINVGTGTWNGTSGGHELPNTQTTFIDWPSIAQWSIPVPKWATHCYLDIELKNVHLVNGSAYGEIMCLIGGLTTTPIPFDLNKEFSTGPGGIRQHLVFGGEFAFSGSAAALRGTTALFKMRGRKFSSAELGDLFFDRGSIASIEITFKQKPGLVEV